MSKEELKIIDADTLLSVPMKKTHFIVDGLIPEGISILCGAPKIGKSWLMLWLGLQVSQGLPVWNLQTRKCDVLYLSLEDPFHRIQERLYALTESAPDNLYFANTSQQIGSGLQRQLHDHIKGHPETGLIIIDTLQKVRNTEKSNSLLYAADYDDITALKKIADRYGIAIIVVHHLRKNPDSKDPFNQISGTTGLTGAVDSAYVITKSSRSDETALLTAGGRDIEHQQLNIRFTNRTWEVIEHKGQSELHEEAIPPLLYKIANFIHKRGEWTGTASQLLTVLGDTETSPIILTRMLSRFFYEVLQPENIEYSTRRTAQDRLITLKVNDGHDRNDRSPSI